MMLVFYGKGLINSGEYVVIYFDRQQYKPDDPTYYFRSSLIHMDDAIPDNFEVIEAMQSLLIITSTHPANPEYEHFKQRVNEYNDLPPFSFPNPFALQKPVTEFAANLYDSVFLYARAVDAIIRKRLRAGLDVSMMEEHITNGTDIIDNICGKRYKSKQF